MSIFFFLYSVILVSNKLFKNGIKCDTNHNNILDFVRVNKNKLKLKN